MTSGTSGTSRPWLSCGSAVTTDDRGAPRDRLDFAAIGDIGGERLESRDVAQRVRVSHIFVLDDHMDEAHAVLEAEDLVGESFGLPLGELLEDLLYQSLVLLGPIGLGLVTNDDWHGSSLRPSWSRPKLRPDGRGKLIAPPCEVTTASRGTSRGTHKAASHFARSPTTSARAAPSFGVTVLFPAVLNTPDSGTRLKDGVRGATTRGQSMNLMRTKTIEQSIADTEESEHQLRKELGPVQLTVIGVG